MRTIVPKSFFYPKYVLYPIILASPKDLWPKNDRGVAVEKSIYHHSLTFFHESLNSTQGEPCKNRSYASFSLANDFRLLYNSNSDALFFLHCISDDRPLVIGATAIISTLIDKKGEVKREASFIHYVNVRSGAPK